MLARADAPRLSTAVDEVARRLGARPPGQIRLTYLPCCGVVAWGRSRALILGLPLLHVLTLAELRAVLAHELAHLARGDATRAARSARFVEGLGQALERSGRRRPSRARSAPGRGSAGARTSRLIGADRPGPGGPRRPLGRRHRRGQRRRLGAGQGRAGPAPLPRGPRPLRPDRPDAPNLYAFFRAFWYRLPPEVHTAMRLQLLANGPRPATAAHPPLPDRLALVQSYPDPCPSQADAVAGHHLLGDLEGLEQMLHNRLFGVPAVEPSVFHRSAGRDPEPDGDLGACAKGCGIVAGRANRIRIGHGWPFVAQPAEPTVHPTRRSLRRSRWHARGPSR